MKRILILATILVSSALPGFSQGSVELGDSGEFSQLTYNPIGWGETPAVFDSDNNLYLCYTENGKLEYGGATLTNNMKTIVMKYNGNTWTRVGGTSATSSFPQITPIIAVDRFDTLYTAYWDGPQGAMKPSIHKFNGFGWMTVGSPMNFTNNLYGSTILWLKFDKNNMPYFSYADNNDSIHVYRYNGSAWNKLPNCGLSNSMKNTNIGTFGFDIPKSDSMPYVSGAPAQGQMAVKRFNFSTGGWEFVGSTSIPSTPSDSATTHTRLVFNSAGVPHLIYADMQYNRDLVVKRFSGGTWNTVGSKIHGVVYTFHLTFGPGDTPYVVSNTNNDQYGCKVYKFNGTDWDNVVENNLFENRLMGRIIFNNNGVPHGAFLSFINQKGEVRKFAANAWTLLAGKPKVGLSEGEVEQTSIKVNNQGDPIVLFRDLALGGRAVMKRYDPDSNKWFTIGNGPLTTGDTKSLKMDIDQSGKLYAVFGDGDNGYRTTMRRFDGTAWQNVGTAGFSSGSVSNVTMAVSNAGVPYTAYSDNGFGDKATVKKFDGNWVFVGSSGFSSGEANYTNMTLSDSGVPYIIYSDEGDNERAHVKQFNGTDWIDAGAGVISPSAASFTSLAIDKAKNITYALYTNTSTGKFTVSKYENSSWSDVGSPSFTDSIGGGGSIGLDRSGAPHVIFPDPLFDDKASIMMYNGTNWTFFGERGFSAGRVTTPSLSFDDSNNLFVVYASSQAFARKFTNANVGVANIDYVPENTGSVYPNPSNGILHFDIHFGDLGKPYTIYDMQGREKFTDKIRFEKNVIDLSSFTKGVYFLKVKESTRVYKLVIK